jgi:hypothetical protein
MAAYQMTLELGLFRFNNTIARRSKRQGNLIVSIGQIGYLQTSCERYPGSLRDENGVERPGQFARSPEWPLYRL